MIVLFRRHDFSATITQQDLVDSYLFPFQSCVEKGKVSGLMCSYNAINGGEFRWPGSGSTRGSI